MKRLLVAALLVLAPARLEAAVTFGQAQSNTVGSGTSTLTLTMPSTPTNGSTLLACVHIFNSGGAPTGNSVSDDGGNSYSLLQGESAGGGGVNTRFECFRAVNITGVASHDVTWTASSGTVGGSLTVSEWLGTATSPVDQSNISTVGNTSSPTGTAITSSGNGMHVTFLGWDNFSVTHTAGSGWTEAHEVTSGGFLSQAISYRTAATSTSQTPSATLSGTAGFGRYIHVTLLESGGGGGSTAAKNCPMIGVCE